MILTHLYLKLKYTQNQTCLERRHEMKAILKFTAVVAIGGAAIYIMRSALGIHLTFLQSVAYDIVAGLWGAAIWAVTAPPKQTKE